MIVDDGVGGYICNHARTGRSLVDQRSVGNRHARQPAVIIYLKGSRNKVAVAVVMAGAEFGYLADAAGDRILVTFGAGLGIVDRTQSFGDIVAFFESLAVAVVNGLRNETVG